MNFEIGEQMFQPQFPPVQPPKQFVPPVYGESIVCDAVNYYIGHQLGQGSFGTVYECTDDWNNRLVAKVLSPNKSYEEVRNEWNKELSNLHLLRHPNITFIHKAFEYRNTFYIIVERCESTLGQLISQHGFDGHVWFPYIARDILHGLDYIHSHNYAHKDLHASNVFVSNQFDLMVPSKAPVWSFKIGDFGISNIEWLIRPNSTNLAQWMLAPEAINPAEFGMVGRSMDIYHVGLLLLQLLSDQSLNFSHEQILRGVPRQSAEELNSPYSTVLSKALRRHVSCRTPSAIQMWREIKQVISPWSNS